MGKLHVEIRGSGPKVLMVHGGEEGGGLSAYEAQMPLSQTFTLLLPDLPGHGKTPAEGVTNIDADADLVVEELLTERMHVVGNSYGGGVVLRAAAKRPEMVRSLTLIEPNTMDIAASDPVVLQMLMEIMQAVQIPDLRQRAIAFANVLGVQKEWPDPLPENYRLMSENLPNLLKPNPNALPTGQLTEKVVAAGVPSLVISGGHREAWEHICDAVAKALNAQRTVITGFGHAPQQNGLDFNARMEKFWTSVP
ncbi:MAG: alpha/beta fold hydrolase [Anaerolineaceae bacterium]|nr:alpha/beta fold hydrolase [Anaerolineaceae bacterium]